jgi:glycosyltransferase involved in cell wall biosynthesis
MLPYSPWDHQGPNMTMVLPGRLTAWKGQLFAAQAMDLIADSVSLRLVGSPTTPRDRKWVKQALDPVIALSEKVSIEPTTSALSDLYDGAQFVLQASQSPEPFGRTVIEGMAKGLIPIVPDAGGPAEIVRPGVDGFEYRASDAESLAATIHRAVATPQKILEQMSRTARMRVEDSFTTTANAQRVIASVLDAGPPNMAHSG